MLALVGEETAAADDPGSLVTATATATPEAVGPGGDAELRVSVTIAPGWHVNAHIPSEPYLIPTDLTIAPPLEVEVGEVHYPEGERTAFAFNPGKKLATYQGTITLTVPLRVRSDAATDRAVIIRCNLRYQPCSDTHCLRPWAIPIVAHLSVRKGSKGGAHDSTAIPTEAGRGSTILGGLAKAWLERGNVFTYPGAFILGLLMNLTPCVYPLIAVTVALFGGQGDGSRARVVGLAAVYVLGIAVTFSALGVASALSGSAFGMALQQPVVLVLIAAVLLALAASSFGLYRFRIPVALGQWAARPGTGVGGALFMGLTMGLVAAPCVGPVLAGLFLIVAARQQILFGFSLFFVLSIGLGAPYILLAALASAARKLPRSGGWLTWVEKLLGFVLMGLALFYLEPILPAGTRNVARMALLVVGGVYLGFLHSFAGESLRFVRLKRVVGVAALGVALWSVAAVQPRSLVSWQPFTPEALAAARSTGTPAVIDFSADWCIPCREMDASTFNDPAVVEASRTFAMLRADVTLMDTETDEIMRGHNVLGVPTYLFFSANGEEAERLVGFVPSEEFLEAMRKAAAG
jgi:thiol:disulfide interchange protein DsbD